MKYLENILGIRIHQFLQIIYIKPIKDKNEQIANQVNDALIGIRNAINKKITPENENPDKLIDIVEKIVHFNKQQKGRGLKILTSKQILQRLPIAFAQVKTDSTSENLLNKIHQILYSLFRETETPEKAYNNIMNSIQL